MTWLLAVLLTFGVSATLTVLIRRYAIRCNLLDQPNERSSHITPTPRGGGLAIVASFLGASIYCWFSGLIPESSLLAVFAGALLVAGVGFWDDHDHVSAKWRLLVHAVAVILAIAVLQSLSSTPLNITGAIPKVLVLAILAIAVVWFLNLFNFMDGIDGIAAVETITVSIGASLILWGGGQPGLGFWLVLLAAATAGFLVWNWPPAKIFMGDAGSGFLGFVMAIIAIDTIQTTAISYWSWLILLGVFLADATMTLVRRMIRGDSWYKAHCTHAYQHAAKRLDGHLYVTLGIAVINLVWLFPLAWLATKHREAGVYLALIAYLPLVVLVSRMEAGKPNAS